MYLNSNPSQFCHFSTCLNPVLYTIQYKDPTRHLFEEKSLFCEKQNKHCAYIVRARRVFLSEKATVQLYEVLLVYVLMMFEKRDDNNDDKLLILSRPRSHRTQGLNTA